MNKTVKFDDLPLWVKNNITQQHGAYMDYFEAKWIENVDLKELDGVMAKQINYSEFTSPPPGTQVILNPDQSLPKHVLDLLKDSGDGHYVRITMLDGTRVLGLNTKLGPVALYEIHALTEVPIDEKGTKANVELPNYRLHAPEVFWKAHLLELDQKGGVNLVTFLYLFGLSDPNVPLDKRNLANIAARVDMVAQELGRRIHVNNAAVAGTPIND